MRTKNGSDVLSFEAIEGGGGGVLGGVPKDMMGGGGGLVVGGRISGVRIGACDFISTKLNLSP